MPGIHVTKVVLDHVAKMRAIEQVMVSVEDLDLRGQDLLVAPLLTFLNGGALCIIASRYCTNFSVVFGVAVAKRVHSRRMVASRT